MPRPSDRTQRDLGSSAEELTSGRPPSGAAASVYLPPFRVDVTVRPGVALPISRAALARAMAAALEAGGAPRPASIGLILSEDGELAELNAAHMGMPGPTDVLSFPLLPPEAYPNHAGRDRAPLDQAATAAAVFPLPPGVRVHVGDVVVSVGRARLQAGAGRGGQTGEVRWSAADELRLLVTHGTLHVCGWDHAEHVEEAAMRSLERELLGAG